MTSAYAQETMKDAEISVITPAYNAKRWIELCIKNVIEQNCRQAEHIIADGASVDGTLEIIRSYAGKYPHIRLLSEKDSGQSDAMNRGVGAARGKIIGVLNADDYYSPGALNLVLRYFTSLREPGFLAGNCNILGEDNKLFRVSKPRKLRLSDLLLGLDINPYPENSSQYFYHKSLHDSIGYYNINLHYIMDKDFIYRAVQAANTRYVDQAFGNMRLVSGSKTYGNSISNESQVSEDELRFNREMFGFYFKKLSCLEQWKVRLFHKIMKYRKS